MAESRQQQRNGVVPKSLAARCARRASACRSARPGWSIGPLSSHQRRICHCPQVRGRSHTTRATVTDRLWCNCRRRQRGGRSGTPACPTALQRCNHPQQQLTRRRVMASHLSAPTSLNPCRIALRLLYPPVCPTPAHVLERVRYLSRC